MERRQFLSCIGGCAGLLSGCLSFGEDELSYARLERLVLMNIRAEPVTIDVKIRRVDTDEEIFREEYTVQPNDPIVVTPDNCPWPDQPIEIMTNNQDDKTWFTFSSVDQGDCLNLMAESNPGGISYFGHTGCPDEPNDC